jgi:UDP-N-acetylmuramoyl-L-alanyl-D-glutamate--2,6-diaminopimelate ligase
MMADQQQLAGASLYQLLQGLVETLPEADCRIGGIAVDSRDVEPGDAFLALHGYREDGSQYIADAAARGAAVILLEEGLKTSGGSLQIPIIPVQDLRAKTGIIAARFYGEPSRKLEVIGITGTNGKTSVCQFIAQALNEGRQGKVGCLGTLGYGLYPELKPGKNTTPDPVTLQRFLAGFAAAAADYAVMEVSSHALEQGRVNGVGFDITVFTNLSHEHLDFHGDMEGYAQAKRKLFLSPGLMYAVINSGDAYGRILMEDLYGRVPVIDYGRADAENKPAVNAVLRHQDTTGLHLEIASPWGTGSLQSSLIGAFNADNLLAALAVLCLLDMPFDDVLRRLSRIPPLPGRMEAFGAPGNTTVIVDYAHTPDALEQALITLKAMCRGRLICVFGCGGERDMAKRPEMGKVAELHADRIIITSDNPRGESPQKIISEIAAGMQGGAETIIDEDRTRAISTAVRAAHSDDIVLVAGKGHETYQEIAGQRYPFSDRQLVRNLLGTAA